MNKLVTSLIAASMIGTFGLSAVAAEKPAAAPAKAGKTHLVKKMERQAEHATTGHAKK